jgi:mannose-6-phosphate isomerase-like protein (cupin superfamily)
MPTHVPPRTDIEQFDVWIQKPWGGEHIITNDMVTNYCLKRLLILAGRKFSYHYHEIKHETFYVLEGRGLYRYAYEDDPEIMRSHPRHARGLSFVPGTIITVPPRTIHQVCANEQVWLIETSTFDRVSDSYRVVKGD